MTFSNEVILLRRSRTFKYKHEFFNDTAETSFEFISIVREKTI